MGSTSVGDQENSPGNLELSLSNVFLLNLKLVPIGDIAYHNKAAIYDILFKASAEALITIAADPKHLGARIAITSVLHTWGSALTHHPHVHIVVPGGGISRDGQRWISCRPGFFLPVRVLSRLFRRIEKTWQAFVLRFALTVATIPQDFANALTTAGLVDFFAGCAKRASK